VERTFPDIPYFELERVRTALVTVLFLFSVLNPDVGYRQVSQNQWVNAD
jgi:TBC1 domain family protein 5